MVNAFCRFHTKPLRLHWRHSTNRFDSASEFRFLHRTDSKWIQRCPLLRFPERHTNSRSGLLSASDFPMELFLEPCNGCEGWSEPCQGPYEQRADEIPL